MLMFVETNAKRSAEYSVLAAIAPVKQLLPLVPREHATPGCHPHVARARGDGNGAHRAVRHQRVPTDVYRIGFDYSGFGAGRSHARADVFRDPPGVFGCDTHARH